MAPTTTWSRGPTPSATPSSPTSYSSEWSIAQVLSHLGSGAEIMTGYLEAASDGRPTPGRDTAAAIQDRCNALTPEEQARDGCRSDRALVSRLESLDDAQLASLRVAALGTELDAAGLVGLRLGEHAIPTWDVAVMLDGGVPVAL
ncbi:MAG TPA: maleylpyruvate isomerase N-terminal domain-containing protein [Verrucomicrobiae bacterium]|nr:maleylpyruvate isomerase N-terminal domain-containing protein [Verrucomicrobiae bacterium]